MSQAHGDAETYASVLEHAPILRAPAGYVPGPDELDGVIHVGSGGWDGFIAPGPDVAQFIAEAIEPFLSAPEFNAEAVIQRLTDGTPPALGDGGRALDAQEAERIVDVCRMLMVTMGAPARRSSSLPDAVEMNDEPVDEPTEGDVVITTVEEFANMAEILVNYAAKGVVVRIVHSEDEAHVVASLIPGNGTDHPNQTLYIIPKK